jgi:hypothetical protein
MQNEIKIKPKFSLDTISLSTHFIIIKLCTKKSINLGEIGGYQKPKSKW